MDEVVINLPVSNKEVVIRNYTTRKDDDRAEALMYAGVTADPGVDGRPTMTFPVANMMASKRSYIPRLVQLIDGNSQNIPALLDDLRSEDYAAIETEVEKIVEEHSPTAQEAKNASSSTTKAK